MEILTDGELEQQESLEEQPQEVSSIDELASMDSTEDELLEATRKVAESLSEGDKEVEETKPEEPEQEEVVEKEVEIGEPEETKSDTEPENVSDFKPVVLKDRGVEVTANNMDELIKFAQLGVNSTRKTQELAKHKSKVDYMASNEITMEDLHRLADLKSGNKEVLSKYAKELNIDLYDIDAEKEYVPSADKKYSEPTEHDMFLSEVSQDAELVENIKSFSERLPESFRQQVGQNPELFRAYVQDIKTGVANEIKPIADKISALNPSISYMEAYIQAANSLDAAPTAHTEPVREVIAEPKQKVSVDKSKVGKPSGSASSGNSLDFWDDALSEDALVDRIREAAMSAR